MHTHLNTTTELPETMTCLTLAVITYHHTGEGLKEIQDTILILAYRYPTCTRVLSDDDAGDFLLFFIPRMMVIINEFTYQGYSFETYLKSCIRWRVKSFHQLQKRQYVRELSYMHNITHTSSHEDSYELLEEIDDLHAAESVPWYHRGPSDAQSTILKSMNNEPDRRRMLLIALHSARFVDDVLIEKLAIFCQRPKKELFELFDTVWDLQSQQWERIEQYRVKRDRLFASYLDCQIQIETSVDPEEILRLKDLEHAIHVRMAQTREHLAYLERGLPQTTLARIVGIPKGTVNSGFFYMRRKLSKYRETNHFS